MTTPRELLEQLAVVRLCADGLEALISPETPAPALWYDPDDAFIKTGDDEDGEPVYARNYAQAVQFSRTLTVGILSRLDKPVSVGITVIGEALTPQGSSGYSLGNVLRDLQPGETQEITLHLNPDRTTHLEGQLQLVPVLTGEPDA